jgi:hypothetical protein
MHRSAFVAALVAAVAAPAVAAPAPASACDMGPVCTTVRFVQTCSAVVVREAQETVATGRPQTIACPL